MDAELKSYLDSFKKDFDTRFKDLETKFDTKFNDLETKFDTRFKDLETKFDTRFKDIETKFDTRFKDLDTKFDTKFNDLETKIEVNAAATRVEFDEVRSQIERTETRLLSEFWKWGRNADQRIHRVEASDATTVERLRSIEDRVFTLERKVAGSKE
jgi:hypothetical protein